MRRAWILVIDGSVSSQGTACTDGVHIGAPAVGGPIEDVHGNLRCQPRPVRAASAATPRIEREHRRWLALRTDEMRRTAQRFGPAA